jgi:hypothetical protein
MKIKVILSCILFSLLFTSCDKVYRKYYDCECTNSISGETVHVQTYAGFRLTKKKQENRCKSNYEDSSNSYYTNCHIK